MKIKAVIHDNAISFPFDFDAAVENGPFQIQECHAQDFPEIVEQV